MPVIGFYHPIVIHSAVTLDGEDFG